MLGAGSRAPFALQVVAKFVKVAAILAGGHDGAGAKAVPDRLQDESRSFFDLFEWFHIVFGISKPIRGYFAPFPAFDRLPDCS